MAWKKVLALGVFFSVFINIMSETTMNGGAETSIWKYKVYYAYNMMYLMITFYFI